MNEWVKALAFAPRVSMEYWKTLSVRYADHLSDEESAETYPYLLLSNQITKAIEFFMNRKEFSEAFILSAMKS